MRLFRLFLAAVVLLVFGLSTMPARAVGTVTWSLPQWKNRHGTNRLTDLLNRDDCLSDATATFSIQVRGTIAAGAVLEMWVGNACDTAANRLPANQQCVQVTSAETAITAMTVQVRMQDMVKAYGSSETGTKASCDVEASTGLVTRSLFFVVYNSGSTTSEATAMPWAFRYDVRAPVPPTNIRAGSGEESLVTSFTAVTGESNLLHYKFYCSPVGPAPNSGGSGGSTSIAKQEIGGTGGTDTGGTTGTDTGGTSIDTGGTSIDTGGTSIDTGGTSIDTGGTTGTETAGTDSGGTTTGSGTGEVDGTAGESATSGNGQSDDASCTSSILIPGEPAPEGAIDCGQVGAQGATGGETKAVLENTQFYAVAVATEDGVNNVGVLSKLACATPMDVTGFYESYRQAGGEAGGGYCTFAPARQGALSALVALLVGACAFLRRRR